MNVRSLLAFPLLLLFAGVAAAADHRIEKLDEAAPVDAVGDEIAGKLQATGARVFRGESREAADIWLANDLGVDPGAAAGGSVQYPLQQGQLVGVIRYPREGSDFRDQDIPEGVYTMRYALQPVDGAHIGTFATRDFILLSRAADDQSAAPVDVMTLVERAMDAAEASHPATLALLKLEEKAESRPGISHDEEHDWWIARLEAPAKEGKLPVDLVVVGYVEE
ncbi:MAG: hypothetical protein KY475_11545 [Planctomycetes bacterium]|nr:hypothetical protein [Planctomycetota bacterium]